jgi:hypothetical protein
MLRRRQRERRLDRRRRADGPGNTAIPSPGLTTAGNRRSCNSYLYGRVSFSAQLGLDDLLFLLPTNCEPFANGLLSYARSEISDSNSPGQFDTLTRLRILVAAV